MRIFLSIAFIALQHFCIFAQNRVESSPTIIKQDGKYGIVDEKGNTTVFPSYDTILCAGGDFKKLELLSVNPFFILKKGDKYGYVYCQNIDSNGIWLPEKERYWITGECIYNSIEFYGFGADTYDYNDDGFGSWPYLILKYNQNGKWGLIYVRARSAALKYFATTAPYPGGLGTLRMTNAKYDNIGYPKEDGIYDIKLNGKCGLLQIIYTPSNRGPDNMQKWINLEYTGQFDSVKVCYSNSKEYSPLIRFVNKEGKWGLIRLMPETMNIKELIPCESSEMITTSNTDYFLSQNFETGTIRVYDILNNKKFSYNTKKELIEKGHDKGFSVFHLDTIPSKENFYQRTYVALGFGVYDYEKAEYKKGSELCFIDMKSEKLKTVFNDPNTNYNYFPSLLGTLVMCKKNVGAKYSYSFIDLETGENKFSIELDTTKTLVCYTPGYNGNQDDYDLFNIYNKRSSVEPDGTFINGTRDNPKRSRLKIHMEIAIKVKGKDYATIGYYDFLKKKYIKK